MNLLDQVVAFVRIVRAQAKGAARALLANTDEWLEDDGSRSGGGAEERWYTGGVLVSPDPPEDDATYAEAVVLKEQDEQPIVAWRDLRLHRRANVKTGDAWLPHYGGGFLALQWDDQRRATIVTLYAPHLDAAGYDGQPDAAHALILDPSSAQNSVILAHALGTALVMDKDGNAYLKSANGEQYLQVNDDGVVITAAGGMKLTGAAQVGDPSSAQEVALYAGIKNVLDLMNTALQLTTALSGPPYNVTAITGALSAVASAMLALDDAAKSTALKASL